MNHFALQAEARRNTVWLVVLAVVAVAAATVSAAAVFASGMWLVDSFLVEERFVDFGTFIANPLVFASSLYVSAAVIAIGFAVKASDIASPNRLMALLGARRIRRSDLVGNDPESIARLTLVNVCEEMSIASGAMMPSVWVLEESSDINAFVAGKSHMEAALCVTAGMLRYLARDELQGVIAHEYSHILNGDMRLNFRLLGLVAGVTAYYRIGKGMLGMSGSRNDGGNTVSPVFFIRYRDSGEGGRGGAAAFVVILLVYLVTASMLWLVGSVSAFFARLVQCAVSRQREYLADASAAQFTRNPEALANALRLTYLAGGGPGRSQFSAWSDDVAHMLFTEKKGNLFATHPSVKDRIRRLSSRGLAADEELRARIVRIREEEMQDYLRLMDDLGNVEEGAMFTGGDCTGDGEEYGDAEEILTEEGEGAVMSTQSFREERQEPDPPDAFAARLCTHDGAATALVEILRGRCPKEVEWPLTREKKRQLAFRCVIAMRDFETEERKRKWADVLAAIAEEDGQIDSFEFMLLAAMRRYLNVRTPRRKARAQFIVEPLSRVLATVASFGADASAGYNAAQSRFSLIKTPLPPMPEPYVDAIDFLDGIFCLDALSPLAKQEFLLGLQEAVTQDGVVSEDEADYVSAVAEAIGAAGWRSVIASTGGNFDEQGNEWRYRPAFRTRATQFREKMV